MRKIGTTHRLCICVAGITIIIISHTAHLRWAGGKTASFSQKLSILCISDAIPVCVFPFTWLHFCSVPSLVVIPG